MTDHAPLPQEFYHEASTVDVARRLLGKLLIRELRGRRAVGRIVETEAYLGKGDSAAHSHRGPTPRNRSMFGPAGRAYVYSIHAKYCFNAVCQDGAGDAVLIRAIEPLEGLAEMARRRGRDKPLELARGPARLCQALDIGPEFDGWNLSRGQRLWIAAGPDVPETQLAIGPRVGISTACQRPLRFAVADCRFVSLPHKTLVPIDADE